MSGVISCKLCVRVVTELESMVRVQSFRVATAEYYIYFEVYQVYISEYK